MKNLLSVIKYCVIIVGISVIFSSCGGFLGIDITDQKAIDSNLKSKLTEIIGEDTPIVEIRLIEGGGETFSKTIVMADVFYLNADGSEVLCNAVTLSGKLEGKGERVSNSYKSIIDGKLKVSLSDTQKLKDIDFSKIASIVNKAGEMVSAEGDEFSGIHGYTITLNSDPAKVEYEFAIQSRQDSKTTTKSGRLATEISYVEYSFKADSEGNLEII